MGYYYCGRQENCRLAARSSGSSSPADYFDLLPSSSQNNSTPTSFLDFALEQQQPQNIFTSSSLNCSSFSPKDSRSLEDALCVVPPPHYYGRLATGPGKLAAAAAAPLNGEDSLLRVRLVRKQNNHTPHNNNSHNDNIESVRYAAADGYADGYAAGYAAGDDAGDDGGHSRLLLSLLGLLEDEVVSDAPENNHKDLTDHNYLAATATATAATATAAAAPALEPISPPASSSAFPPAGDFFLANPSDDRRLLMDLLLLLSSDGSGSSPQASLEDHADNISSRTIMRGGGGGETQPPPPSYGIVPVPSWVPASLRRQALEDPLLAGLSDLWISGLWAAIHHSQVPAVLPQRKSPAGFLQLVFGLPTSSTLLKVNQLAAKLRADATPSSEHYGLLRAWRLQELPPDVSFLVVALYRAFWRARKALAAKGQRSSCCSSSSTAASDSDSSSASGGRQSRIDPHYIGKSLRRLQQKIRGVPLEKQYALALEVMAHVEMLCLLGVPPTHKAAGGSAASAAGPAGDRDGTPPPQPRRLRQTTPGKLPQQPPLHQQPQMFFAASGADSLVGGSGASGPFYHQRRREFFQPAAAAAGPPHQRDLREFPPGQVQNHSSRRRQPPPQQQQQPSRRVADYFQ